MTDTEDLLICVMYQDADPNVLTLIAHDPAPLDTMTFFPNGTLNYSPSLYLVKRLLTSPLCVQERSTTGRSRG
jgi:hypothetical protein